MPHLHLLHLLLHILLAHAACACSLPCQGEAARGRLVGAAKGACMKQKPLCLRQNLQMFTGFLKHSATVAKAYLDLRRTDMINCGISSRLCTVCSVCSLTVRPNREDFAAA